MSEKGTVIEVSNAAAMVEMEWTSACARCGLCRSIGPGKMVLEVEPLPGLQVGQRVLLEGLETSWKASILLFLVPVADMLIGVVLGQYVTIGNLSNNASSAIFGAGFFLVSLVCAIFLERRMRVTQPAHRPHIAMILDEDSTPAT